MKLSDAAYVLWIEGRSTHKEDYFCLDNGTTPYRGPFEEAEKFETPAAAYEFAKMFQPEIDNFRVGLRNGRE
jgi:hypothetical protein